MSDQGARWCETKSFHGREGVIGGGENASCSEKEDLNDRPVRGGTGGENQTEENVFQCESVRETRGHRKERMDPHVERYASGREGVWEGASSGGRRDGKAHGAHLGEGDKSVASYNTHNVGGKHARQRLRRGGNWEDLRSCEGPEGAGARSREAGGTGWGGQCRRSPSPGAWGRKERRERRGRWRDREWRQERWRKYRSRSRLPRKGGRRGRSRSSQGRGRERGERWGEEGGRYWHGRGSEGRTRREWGGGRGDGREGGRGRGRGSGRTDGSGEGGSSRPGRRGSRSEAEGYQEGRGGRGGGWRQQRGRSSGREDGRRWSGSSEGARAGSEGRESDGSRDDRVGHYEGREGDMIRGRYEVLGDVGMGTFGRVVQCLDRKRGREVAVKVVRSIPRYTESALVEADILGAVNEAGGRGLSHCVQLFRDFVFQVMGREGRRLSGTSPSLSLVPPPRPPPLPQEHCCLVFERLGTSLYDFMKAHDYQPYPLFPHVRDFARQLLEALEFLEGLRLVHTDLKPENVLLCGTGEATQEKGGRPFLVPASTKVKVIDFGGATFDDDARKSTIINTRQYRAPEVILEIGWSYPSDLWSVGCIIAELYKGDVLFATHNNTEHLALMERCLGPFPRHMLEESREVAPKFFDMSPQGKGRSRWREDLDAESQRHVRRMPWLSEVFQEDKDSGIVEVVQGLLEIDPRKRLTATQALKMPFFAGPFDGR